MPSCDSDPRIPGELLDAGFRPAEGRSTHRGMRNHNLPVSRDGELFNLRLPRDPVDTVVVDYVNELYDAMGVERLGGELELRSPLEQASITDALLAQGLRAPRVVRRSEIWLLLEYVEGVRLKERLESGDLGACSAYLRELHRAHEARIVLGDRWGGNELVTASAQIVFFDFDFCVRTGDARGDATFDLAPALRSILLWAPDKAAALDILRLAVSEDASGHHVYDPELLVEILLGACRFYERADRPLVPGASSAPGEQRAVNVLVRRLVDAIRPTAT